MFLDEYSFEKKVSSFMAGVYGWMSTALMITAGAAYYVASTPVLFAAVMQPSMAMVLIFVQLLIVLGITFLINRMSFVTALLLFLVYSCCLGVTLSSIFYIYAHASIISTFLSTAGMFGLMSLYGYFTQSDLTTIGNLSLMALFGLIIAMIANMFMRSAQFDYVISAIGALLFVALTAYDTQKIKELARAFYMQNQSTEKITVIGALTLYLDFINLFLFVLRLFGKKDER